MMWPAAKRHRAKSLNMSSSDGNDGLGIYAAKEKTVRKS